jgi:hypothetical protein
MVRRFNPIGWRFSGGFVPEHSTGDSKFPRSAVYTSASSDKDAPVDLGDAIWQQLEDAAAASSASRVPLEREEGGRLVPLMRRGAIGLLERGDPGVRWETSAALDLAEKVPAHAELVGSRS